MQNEDSSTQAHSNDPGEEGCGKVTGRSQSSRTKSYFPTHEAVITGSNSTETAGKLPNAGETKRARKTRAVESVKVLHTDSR
jgi:hypothetical protein